MEPTAKLRFVERQLGPFKIDDKNTTTRLVRVLQQWWAYEEDETIGEWRDVRLEDE
jgi:hypothetical protein